jgi:extracellular elastinolytic metalloproteinase
VRRRPERLDRSVPHRDVDGREHFTTRAQGTLTAANDFKLNLVSPSGGTVHRVRFVRFFMLSTQVPAPVAQNCAAGGFSGCDFMDMTELEAYGSPSR